MSAGPFLYADELETILGSARSVRKVLVFGGPGMGKTTLIEAVRDRSGRTSELVRGRRGDPGVVERIVSWATDPARRDRDLLIDNLDHIFSMEVERALRDLPDTEDGLGRIICTSGTPTKWLEKQGAPPPDPERADLNLLVHDSTALNAFQHIWLDPWPHGWDRTTPLRVAGALRRSWSEMDGALVELESREGRRTYADMLVEGTGGHPALLGAAFRWLLGRLERQAWRRDHATDLTDPEPLPDVTPLGLADSMDRELRESQLEVIGRAVDWVEAQSADALDEVLEMAASDDVREVLLERTLLSKAGLVRRREGGWGLAGRVIRECIVHRHERMPDPAVQQQRARPSRPAPPPPDGVSLEPDSRVPNMQGRVVWAIDGERRELALSGASWKILQVLAEADGALVTVPQLAERTAQESHKAIRSALQRLISDLRGQGLIGLVVNVRRQGYLYDADCIPEG